MTEEANIELLIRAINSTENLNGEEFNKHPDALEAFIKLFGKEKYNEILNSSGYAVYNKFYNPTWCFEKEVERNGIASLKVKEYIDTIIHQPRKNHMLLYLIDLTLLRGELEMAIGFIDELSEEKYEFKFYGYRKILRYYAENANLKEFEKYLKLAQPTKSPRNDISDSKSIFLSKYSELNGILKGIELLNSKIFGWKLCYSVLENTAHKLTIEEINDILCTHSEFEKEDEYIKQWFHIRHYSNQKPTNIDDLNFRQLIDNIMLIDKAIKRGDGRLRDYLLYDLGSSVENLDQINICKNNIIAPFYKKELNYHIKNVKEKTMGNK